MKNLINLPQSPIADTEIVVGDTVRSYRRAFTNAKPYKDCFIQGVVIGLESWIKQNDRLIVKWQIDKHFDVVNKFAMPHDGSDIFSISKACPHLVKVNNNQLTMPL